jgi:hypothetical protein
LPLPLTPITMIAQARSPTVDRRGCIVSSDPLRRPERTDQSLSGSFRANAITTFVAINGMTMGV